MNKGIKTRNKRRNFNNSKQKPRKIQLKEQSHVISKRNLPKM